MRLSDCLAKPNINIECPGKVERRENERQENTARGVGRAGVKV